MNFKETIKPNKKKIIIFSIILILGILDWYNPLNTCESPLFGQCNDYPFEHHPDVIPGLYPPLMFSDGCTTNHEKTSNFLGWECKPNSWKLGLSEFCEASCNVSSISWIYTLLYWYILAILLSHIKRK